jgi:uncharacterized glyoxalase superfamily protein PhnB
MPIRELFPYLRVGGAGRAISFYEAAFGAKEKYRLTEPGGRIGHAELDFGGTTVMLSEEYPERGITSPEAVGGTTVALHLHVDNADETMARAVEAGGTMVREVRDQFYGERSGTVRDPFGHEWVVGHSIEDIQPAEMQRRYDALMKSGF